MIIIYVRSEGENYMKTDEIYEFLKKINDLNFTELDIQTDEFKINMKRKTTEFNTSITDVRQPLTSGQVEKNDKASTLIDQSEYITAPISGIFYRASEPGAEPFVKEGDKVKKGSTLCFLEAMKTMNEIKAGKDCIITGVLVENNTRVDAGDKLFKFVGEL